MKLTLALLLLTASPALAQMDHSAHHGHQMEKPDAAPVTVPEATTSGAKHAADTLFGPDAMAAARNLLYDEMGGSSVSKFIIDRLEWQNQSGADGYLWDAQGWIGGDIDKFWWKTEGEGEVGGGVESAEIQALWSHAIGPFFDFQAGARYDIRPEPDRPSLVIGVQGLAPYMFEIDAAAFLSSKGDISATIEAEYDQRITQKLILQPRVEINFAAQDIPEYGLGSGLSSIEAGVRLRYQFSKQLAPYIGLDWERRTGATARFARADGEDPSKTRLVIGVRSWF